MFSEVFVCPREGGSSRSLSGGSLCQGAVSVHRGLCTGGFLSSRGVSVHGDLCLGDPPHTVMSGRYASYWNAFLLISVNAALLQVMGIRIDIVPMNFSMYFSLFFV